MLKFIKIADDYLLNFLCLVLLIFIPLYPKLPLFEVLPGYIVRVRLEDFLISFTIIIWLIWIARGKITVYGNPLTKPILFYLSVGFLSMISAVFVIQTVPLETLHLSKLFLHFLRRIEYFSLFFIFYTTVKNLKIFRIYLIVLLATVVAVALYGFGQKYLYWPAFSTMNREYAKGWILYLTKHARVLSTFGGHYDLAAYIMMVLILLWSLFFAVKKWFLKAAIFLIIAAAFWTLILTASRTSFIAYIFGLTFAFFLWAYKKGFIWSVTRWLAIVSFSIIIMLSFGDLSERFTKLLKINDRFSGIKSLLTSPIGKPPQDRAVFLENNPKVVLSQITAKSDQPPSLTRPSDVYQDIPLPVAKGKEIEYAPRTYSKTAFMYDLSTAIRFDALWPMAVAGFKRNPLFGSGYSTLNKTSTIQFTEAESTDNDYLRALGETGLLGFVSFYGMYIFILYLIWRNLIVLRDPVLFASSVGLGGLLFGLLVNAVYIDVFESSKVAFVFWSIAGMVISGLTLTLKERKQLPPKPFIPGFANFQRSLIGFSINFFKSDKFILLIILSIALILRLYKIDTPLADWHSWRQADTSAVTRNFVKHGINILYPTYDDLSNIASGRDNPKGLRFVEFPIYNLVAVFVDKIFVGRNIEYSGRMTSILASLGSIVFIFLITRKHLGRMIGITSAFFLAVLPYNIFYSRVILPEPFLVFTCLGMIYFFDKLTNQISNLQHQISNTHIKYQIFSAVTLFVSLFFTIASVLIKPFAAFLFIPLTYLWIKKIGFSVKSTLALLVYWIVCLLPFIWWRWWMSQYPEGIPANMWLLNGDGIRFKGAFFYWLFAERLSKLILGYWGLPFLILGIFSPTKKMGWFFNWWGISMLLYVSVFATGNVRHDYYQIITIPIIAIFAAKGVVFLFELSQKIISRPTVFCTLIIIFLFMEMFGWYQVRDFYNINHPEIVEAGSEVDRTVKRNVLVIAPYNGDTAFLYQTNRAGWPIVQGSIEELIQKGAHYYVSVVFDDLTKELIREATLEDPLLRKYKIIQYTDKYIIIQLVPDSKLPK